MLLALDNTNRSFSAKQNSAGSNCKCTATYADHTSTSFTEGIYPSILNGTTSVTVVPSPGANTRRVVKSITFFNPTAVSHTITLLLNDNGMDYEIVQLTIGPGGSWSSDDLSGINVGGGLVDGTKNEINVASQGTDWAIVDGKVTNSKIAINTIGLNKLVEVTPSTTGVLLGRAPGSVGSVNSITLGPNLVWSNGVLDAQAGVTTGLKGDIDVVSANEWRIASGTVSNSDLVNSTISGVALGSSLANLTAGTGLSSAGTYNGSTARTFTIDTSVVVTLSDIQTLTNKTLTSPTISSLANFSANTGFLKVTSGSLSVDTQTYVNTTSALNLTGPVYGSATLSGSTINLATALNFANFPSQSANTFLAAPNASSGAPSFRTIVAADIPTLNQNTTGTAGNVTGVVAVANGGTGASTASTALANLFPSYSGNGSRFLALNSSATDVEWVANAGRISLGAAQNYFVAPSTGTVSGSYLGFSGWANGNNSNNGTSAATPWASIQYALDYINGLDTKVYTVNLYIYKGTYTESLIIISPNLTRTVNVYGDNIAGTGVVFTNGFTTGLASSISFYTGTAAIARDGSNPNIMRLTLNGSTTALSTGYGWGVGDTIVTVALQDQTTVSGVNSASSIVVASVSGLAVNDDILIRGTGPTKSAGGASDGTCKITAIDTTNKILTLAPSFTTAPSVGAVVYKIIQQENVLTAISDSTSGGNTTTTFTSGTAWPATSLAGGVSVSGLSLFRAPSVVIQPTAGQTCINIQNTRTYNLNGLHLKARNGGTNLSVTRASIIGLNAIAMHYSTTTTLSYTCLFASDGSHLTSPVSGSAGVVFWGTSQYPYYVTLCSTVFLSSLTAFCSIYGGNLTSGAMARANIPTAIFCGYYGGARELAYNGGVWRVISCGYTYIQDKGGYMESATIY